MRQTFVRAALATSLVGACTHPLPLNPLQARTISPQAKDLLDHELELFTLPIIGASDDMIRKVRTQFAAVEKQQLDEMIARFHPSIARTRIGGVKVTVITPAAHRDDRVLLYIHGGGYVMGSATDRTGMLMAHDLGVKMYSIDYDLAPEAKFPVALNQALSVYRELIKTHDPSKIILLSTSAGSGHALGMLLKAQAEGLPMVGANILLSPAVDLTPVGDSITSNDGRDLMTYKNHADKLYVRPFVGSAKIDDPLVSPIYGTYRAGYPPTVIVTGTRDVFLSGSSRFYWKLRDADIPSEVIVSEGMWHAFTNYPDLPEAIQARREVVKFVDDQLARAEARRAADNTAVVRRYIDDVVNHGALDEIDALWTSEPVWHGGSSMGDVRGAAAFHQFMAANVGGAFTGMKLDVHDVIAAGDKVVLRFTNSGDNTGSFMGMPATNRHAAWDGIGIYRLEHGRIAEAWFAEDLVGMFEALGLSALPSRRTP